MSTHLMRLYFAFALALSTLITLDTSYAFDEQNVLKKFQTYAQENNIIFTFNSVEKTNDGALVIKNADYFDEKSKSRQQIDVITLNNVRESAGGNLQYDSIEISNLVQKAKVEDNEITISIERIVSEGFKFSNDPQSQNAFWPTNIAVGEITNMTIESKGGRGNSKILFPSAIVEDTQQTNLRNFNAKIVKLAPGTGTIKTGKDTIAVSIGAITVENMKQFGVQGFDIGLIDAGVFEMNMTSKSGEDVAFVFEGFTVENFFSPDLSIEGASLVSDKNLNAEIKPLEITIDDAKFAGWKRGSLTRQNASANTVTSDARIEDMYLDFTQMPENPKNAELLKTLQELDLVKMVLDIEGTGSWERDTGLLEISRYNIKLEDGASFGMSARISGYTEEIARQFTKALNTMNAETDKQKKNALAFQAMAYLAGLSVQRMEVILDDQSLLDRVVNLQAKKLKQEPEQIKGLVGPMTTIMLTPYNIPELAAQTSQALGTFMQGNKKLTITAEPTNGLAITEMLALGSGVRAGTVTPADLANRLNLTIIAE